MPLYLFFVMTFWEERSFDYIILRAEDIGVKDISIQDIYVFSFFENQFNLLPFQVDEVEYVKGKKNYKLGDGFFDKKDELVFPARYCGNKLDKESIKDLFDLIFEVEAFDRYTRRYCYIGIRSKRGIDFRKLPSEGISVLEKDNEIIVSQDNRYSVFDNSRPVVKSIEIRNGDKFEQVFFGLRVDIYIELLSLISLRKTERDIYAKPIFIKSGDVRVVRVIRPYADIGFGIKIPGADTISYIYKGFMYVENVVPIPFDLKYLSRKAYANIYLAFSRPRRFISEKNNVLLGDSLTEVQEDEHMWGFLESDFWSAAYFIKEITQIPIKRKLYYKDDGNMLYVGINLDILNLPRGEHRFALYGFFMPPGNIEIAKKKVFDPLRFRVKHLI